ncbi:MAG: hypothetical protein K2K83_02030, partial [Rikenella sp.]|nr:hypothetical protein [Rikenella sp.]
PFRVPSGTARTPKERNHSINGEFIENDFAGARSNTFFGGSSSPARFKGEFRSFGVSQIEKKFLRATRKAFRSKLQFSSAERHGSKPAETQSSIARVAGLRLGWLRPAMVRSRMIPSGDAPTGRFILGSLGLRW